MQKIKEIFTSQKFQNSINWILICCGCLMLLGVKTTMDTVFVCTMITIAAIELYLAHKKE